MKNMIIDSTAIELPARETTAQTAATKYSTPEAKYSKINKPVEVTSIIKRIKSEIPKNWLKDNIFNISMLVLWSIAFGTALHGLTGVMIGFCFGMIIIQARDKKNEK